MADHMSIGEVLALLQAEFPDVTISKIRFLEAQGLIVPERTPSGYRKFHDPDIERLRWILVQQREHFLPLKVIKDRLQAEVGVGAPGADDLQDAVGAGGGTAVATEDQPSTLDFDAPQDAAADAAPSRPVPIWMDDLARQASGPGSDAPGPAAPSPGSARPPAAQPAAGPRADGDEAGGEGEPVGPERRPTPLDGGPTTVSLTAAELATAAGLQPAMVRDLEQYGLLAARGAGDSRSFDGDALVVAQKAAVFARHGVEARHLRMYKMAADREATLLEQVTTTLRHQRRPGARDQSIDLLGELSSAGESLRAALLRSALRQHLRGD